MSIACVRVLYAKGRFRLGPDGRCDLATANSSWSRTTSWLKFIGKKLPLALVAGVKSRTNFERSLLGDFSCRDILSEVIRC